MNCFVYKGTKKQDHFLYLHQQIGSADSAELPQALLDLLGELEFVIEFDLSPDRKLPNADSASVIAQLKDKGYFLQMPKESMWQAEEQLFS